MSTLPQQQTRPTFPWLYALPSGALPPTIRCNDETYELERVFKHDFFAATGLYRSRDRQVVAKFGRASSFFGFPLRWIGRFLRNREVRLYRAVADLDGIPALIGTIPPTGFLHDYVRGHPLGRDEVVADAFFDELESLLAAVHARGIAYVDLNKRQNILMGDDGRPYLIDFQISFDVPVTGFRRWLLSPILRRLQRADWYHFAKHKRRLRPDLLTTDERERVERLSFWIRLHRLIFRPLIQFRRWILRGLKKREKVGVAGSSAK